EVDALVFGRGPGAFTGERIATGMVQGLAFASNKPAIGISNLAALGQRAWRAHGATRVCAAIAPRMDGVYRGRPELQDGCMPLVGLEGVCAPEQVELPRGMTAASGAGTVWQYAGRMAVHVEQSWPQMLSDAADLIELALPLWQSGQTLDAAEAQ